MYKISYVADGVTTEYQFVFPFFQNADVHVAIDGVATDAAAGIYSVVPNDDFTGGSVVFQNPVRTDATIDIRDAFHHMARPFQIAGVATRHLRSCHDLTSPTHRILRAGLPRLFLPNLFLFFRQPPYLPRFSCERCWPHSCFFYSPKFLGYRKPIVPFFTPLVILS